MPENTTYNFVPVKGSYPTNIYVESIIQNIQKWILEELKKS